MNLLRAERDALDAYVPGLDKYLSEIPLLELEQPGCQYPRPPRVDRGTGTGGQSQEQADQGDHVRRPAVTQTVCREPT